MVDIVLSGHDHNYERTFPIGSKQDGSAVTYIVCGNGGTPLRYVSPREWTNYCERVFGFTMINIHGPKLHLQSISIDDRVIDEFTLDKSDPASIAEYRKNLIYYEDIKDAPREVVKAYRAGKNLLDVDHFVEAIPFYKEAFDLDTSCVIALGKWAECLAELERYDEAIELARKAIEKMPVFPDSYFALIESLAGQGKYEEALAWCDKLYAITPDDPEAFMSKADVYEEQGRLDLAIGAMLTALEILPNDSDIHFDLAEYYGEGGDTVNALKFYSSGMDWYMEPVKNDDYIAAEGFVTRGNLLPE